MYDAYSILAMSLILLAMLLRNQIYSLLLFTWHNVIMFVVGIFRFIFRYRIKGIRYGILVHKNIFDDLAYLEKELDTWQKIARERQYSIEALMSNLTKEERGGQISFLDAMPNTNGAKPTVNYRLKNKYNTLDRYELTFKNELYRMRYSSDDYEWVEREHRNVGKRKGNTYEYRWVHVDEFDKRTDRKILKNFPYMPDGSNEMLPNSFKYLPFTWKYIEDDEQEFSFSKNGAW